MSRKQIAEERKRAAAERRKQEELKRKRQAAMARAREVRAELHRMRAEMPKALAPPKIRISPAGYTNRRGAAALLMRSLHTLENWAARGIGPEYELINGRAIYNVARLLAWKGHKAEQLKPAARGSRIERGELLAE
jgi:hypothetical protein